MERTSSLDLFRGSDAFTSLAFLDGQEPRHEASGSNIAAEGLQPSQAFSASMPVSSLHVSGPSQRPSKLLHTSRLAPGFEAWPQTANNPYPSVAMQPPVTARNSFLSFEALASQQPAGTADHQADSFAALLADDTALGFADDCFRRESDLYLSQDRTVPPEAAQHDDLPSSHNSAIDQPQGEVTACIPPSTVPPATQSAASESVPHNSTVATTLSGTMSAASASLHPSEIASASHEVASAQPPLIIDLDNPLLSPCKDSNLPAAQTNTTAADAHTPGAEPQAAHDQLLPGDSDNPDQTKADAPNPTQADSQTSANSGQQHTPKASASSAQLEATDSRDAVVESLGMCESQRAWSVQPALRPTLLSAEPPPETVMAPEGPTVMDASESAAQAPTEDAHPVATDVQATAVKVKAALPKTAVGDSHTAQQGSQHQHASQRQSSSSPQQKLGNSHAAAGRPKLAVQDYQLPLLQTARDAPVGGAQTQQNSEQPAQPVPDGAVTRSSQGTSSSHHKGPAGSPLADLKRHWGHHLVRQVLNALPGRAQHLPAPPPATAEPAAAAAPAPQATSQLASSTAQPAAPAHHRQSARHLPAEPNADPAHIQAQSPTLGSQSLDHLPAAPRLQSPAQHGDSARHYADSTAGDGAAEALPRQAGAQAATLDQGPEALFVPEAAVRPGSDEAAHVQEAVKSLGTKAAEVLKAAMPSGRAGDGSGPAPLPEAATPAGNPNTTPPATWQQPQIPHDQRRPPSILQDLRNVVAAQECVQQPPDPASPTAGSTSQQTPLDATQLPQQALPQLQSWQGVTDMQADRLTTAPQFASLPVPPASKEAAAPPQAGPPCTQCQTPPALPPLAHTPDAMPEDRRTAAASNQDRRVAGANQGLMNESTAVAEHSDSLSTALLPEAEVTAVTAVQEKQPVVRSQRLFEKKAAAAAAQAAADAVVRAAALHDPVTLGVSIKEAELVLAPKGEAVGSTLPLVLAECLASNRSKRVPGGDPLEAEPFRRFVDMVRSNSHEFEAQGRVLRLKQYISADVRPAAINAILEALAVNTLVEVLYIQNFEQGMMDEQLLRLTEVLKKGRIWALNAGENFEISLQAWESFTKELQHTAVAYLYVSEHHLARTDLKRRMQDAIRENRRQAPRRDSEVIKCVGNMWWNPKLLADARPMGSRLQGGESALAPLARDVAASQAGSRHSGSGSQGRKRKLQPVDTAVSSHREGSCQDSGGPLHSHPKRPRSLPQAHAASPHFRETGSTDSQAEVITGEKRSLRIKQRQQRQLGEADPMGTHTTTHSQDTATAAASSPVPSLNRTLQSHPSGPSRRPRALGSRSRLADQYGPASDDSQSADAAAANQAAGDHLESEDSPSTALTEKPEPARTAQKRKRQQQQESIPAAAIATAVHLTRSTDADAMTELSRSSEAGTPVVTQQRRDLAPQPETGLEQQQSEQELDSEQTGSLRRTGRQRKLTPAAAAAVEDFPSLYRSTPQPPPPPAQQARAVRHSSPQSDQDWHEDQETAAAAATPRRGQLKQTRAAPPGAGVSHVQMSQLVRCGILPAGTHELLFKGQPCEVQVLPDGDILYEGELYDTLAKFGRAVLEETGSSKQSCNAWRDLSWQGQRLEALRQEAYTKSQQAKRVQKK